MIYWKRTDVAGCPPAGERVFVVWNMRIMVAMYFEDERTNAWHLEDLGASGQRLPPVPVMDILHWSEMNMPVTR